MFRAFLFATVLVGASTALADDLPGAWNVGGRVITYDWVQFESENGQVVGLDKNTLMKMTNGTVQAGLYIDQGNSFSPYNVKKWFFDSRSRSKVDRRTRPDRSNLPSATLATRCGIGHSVQCCFGGA